MALAKTEPCSTRLGSTQTPLLFAPCPVRDLPISLRLLLYSNRCCMHVV